MLPAAEKRANRFAFRPRGQYTTSRRFRAPGMNTMSPSEPEATAVAAVSADPGSPILTGRVGRTLFWLALPVLAEQTLNMCVVFADIFLARFVGPEATVAVGLTGQFSWLAGILFGLVAGIMVFVSLDELLPTAREYGEDHQVVYGTAGGMAVMALSLLLLK